VPVDIPAESKQSKERRNGMPARRIDVQQAQRDMNSGNALLVCAYDEPEKSEKYRLTNALTLAELQAQEANLANDREIIFYCA
jgi:hypothetical protein